MYLLPIYEIGKLLKFIQISYGYRKNSEVTIAQLWKKYSEFVQEKF